MLPRFDLPDDLPFCPRLHRLDDPVGYLPVG
jgi:hypothetical protein